MTELRPAIAQNSVSPPFQAGRQLRPVVAQGLVGLALGAGLTVLAVAWSQGVLGFLSLVLVLGSLAWISLGVVRHYAGRIRRA